MDIRKRDLLATSIGLGVGAALAASANAQEAEGGGRGGRQARVVNSGVQPSSVDLNYKPRRVNKVIELWEDGQPIYYTSRNQFGTYETAADAYAAGKRAAKTYADAINWNLEQGPLDFTVFDAFMRGLKDGGPTRSGHATPAVYVLPPCTGVSAQYALANSWILGNFLNMGAHGFQICHAMEPGAIEVYCHQAIRYTFAGGYPNTPKVRLRGLRGQGPGDAPRRWGLTEDEYLHVADLWPLNPKGEIMVGLKIENQIAQNNMAKTLALPGAVSFAEWGHNDTIQSSIGLAFFDGKEDPSDVAGPGLRVPPGKTKEWQDVLMDVRRRVMAECKKNKVHFSNPTSTRPGYANIIDSIKEGVMVTGGTEAVAIMGREFSKRKMPV